MALQFFFLLRAETYSANLTLAIGKGFDDAGDIPIVTRRIFGDENDVANLDVAATSGPLWALLQRRHVFAFPAAPKGVGEIPDMAPGGEENARRKLGRWRQNLHRFRRNDAGIEERIWR